MSPQAETIDKIASNNAAAKRALGPDEPHAHLLDAPTPAVASAPRQLSSSVVNWRQLATSTI